MCPTGSRNQDVSIDSLTLDFSDFTLDSRLLCRVHIGPHVSWHACVALSLWTPADDLCLVSNGMVPERG